MPGFADRKVFTITGTSPGSASTAIVGSVARGLRAYDWFTVHANLQGATGGTLNVRLQRKITDDVWSDWVSFTQLADARQPSVTWSKPAQTM